MWRPMPEATVTEVTFVGDDESVTPAYHSRPDNEWRIESHDDEWTVWRWDYPMEEWVPVAITVDEGYPLPESVIRSKGFSGLEVAQEWVRARIAVGRAMNAVSALLDEARDDLAALDLIAVGGDGTTEFADAYREWRRATSRLVALADCGATEGRVS